MKKIVTLGGGGGHARVLQAIKDLPDVSITAICPSTDSGGSTGVLKFEYQGNGYIGDLTKCIAALCPDDSLSKALMYRFENGPLSGHSVKNILLFALEKTNDAKALPLMWQICELGENKVIPVTNEKAELCAKLNLGNNIEGETNIDEIAKNPLWNPNVHAISKVYLKPKVSASAIAINAVKDADYIVICPGDLYSSIIPTLLPEGMKEAINESRAKIIVFLNIMTKKGETDNYSASDMLEKIEERLPRPADYVVCNNAPLPDEILIKYSLENKTELEGLDTNDPRILCMPMAVVEDDQVFTSTQIIRQVIEKVLNS